MTTSANTPSNVVDKARAKAYAAAATSLRLAHPDEFATFYKAECEKAGIAYKPRLTGEQKAAKIISDLLDQYPTLRNEPLIDFPKV
jgi:3-oxoacyl-ACP reductase-like protein